jgi:hypothetical protein
MEEKIMDTLKQTAIDVILKMPDTVKIDEIMYKLYVIDKIIKGDKDIEKGHFVDAVQLRKEIEQW